MQKSLPKIRELSTQLVVIVLREEEFDDRYADCSEAKSAEFIIANDYDRIQTDHYCATENVYHAYVVDASGVIQDKIRGTFSKRPSAKAIVDSLEMQ